jgi:hypothetical protein
MTLLMITTPVSCSMDGMDKVKASSLPQWELFNVSCQIDPTNGSLALFGDHKQIGPFYNSNMEESEIGTKHKNSTMEELVLKGFPCILLKEHYRSVPEIMVIANTLTYQNQLHNCVRQERLSLEINGNKMHALFVNVKGYETQG